jgi:hypothetical protein
MAAFAFLYDYGGLPPRSNGGCFSALELYAKSKLRVSLPDYVPDGYDIACARNDAGCSPQGGCIEGYVVVYSKNGAPLENNNNLLVLTVIDHTRIFQYNPSYYANMSTQAQRYRFSSITLPILDSYRQIVGQKTITPQLVTLNNQPLEIIEGYRSYPSSAGFWNGNLTYSVESNQVPLSELEKMAVSIHQGSYAPGDSLGFDSQPPRLTVSNFVVANHVYRAPAFTTYLNGNQTLVNDSMIDVVPGQQQKVTDLVQPASSLADYDISYSGDCDSSGIISPDKVTAGAELRCQITNTLTHWPPGSFPKPGTKIAAYKSYMQGIWLMNLDGSDQTLVADGYSPSWSPNGTKVVYECGTEICTINSDGSDRKILRDGMDPRWAPDGSRIAYSTLAEGHYRIYIMNTDGSNPTMVTKQSNDFTHPTWSPDGKKLAFQGANERSNQIGLSDQIYTIDANGTGFAELTKENFFGNQSLDDNRLPSWSPDGQKIMYISDRDPNGDQIFLINPDGSNETLLTGDPNGQEMPTWLSDGKRIGYASRIGLATVNVNGSDRVLISNTTGYYDAAWQP